MSLEDRDSYAAPPAGGAAQSHADSRKALEEEKAKAARYLENWQRAQADFDNFRKRSQLEQCETIRQANVSLCSDLLPVLDDFERAIASVPAESAQLPWVEGVKLIYNKLKSALESQGLCAINASGEMFDPCLHEAVMQTEGDQNRVVTELRKGYKFQDKVIRPSMVAVGKGRDRKDQE